MPSMGCDIADELRRRNDWEKTRENNFLKSPDEDVSDCRYSRLFFVITLDSRLINSREVYRYKCRCHLVVVLRRI